MPFYEKPCPLPHSPLSHLCKKMNQLCPMTKISTKFHGAGVMHYFVIGHTHHRLTVHALDGAIPIYNRQFSVYSMLCFCWANICSWLLSSLLNSSFWCLCVDCLRCTVSVELLFCFCLFYYSKDFILHSVFEIGLYCMLGPPWKWDGSSQGVYPNEWTYVKCYSYRNHMVTTQHNTDPPALRQQWPWKPSLLQASVVNKACQLQSPVSKANTGVLLCRYLKFMHLRATCSFPLAPLN